MKLTQESHEAIELLRINILQNCHTVDDVLELIENVLTSDEVIKLL